MKHILSSVKLLIVISVFLACYSCNQLPSHDQLTEEIVVDPALDSLFIWLNKNNMFNGAVAIKKEGKLLLKKGYGFANYHRNDRFQPSTSMEIASVSKQFTATAIALLIQEGKIGLEDTVKKYLGEDFPYEGVTIKNLVTHTSGIPDYEDYFKSNWDTTKIATNADIVRYFKTEKPGGLLPGQYYHYSNSGYILLAEIVEAVSGETLDTFLNNQIFSVANMKQSGFYHRDSIWNIQGYAPAYMIGGKECHYSKPEHLPKKNYYRFLSGRFGSGRQSSSVDDLIKWDSILYTDEILTERGRALAYTIYPSRKVSADFAFRAPIYYRKSLGKLFYLTGSWAGNQSYIKRYIDQKSVIVLLNNTHSPYMKEVRSILDDYLEGKPLRRPRVRAVEQLKRDICNLNLHNLKEWKLEHPGMIWDLSLIHI